MKIPNPVSETKLKNFSLGPQMIQTAIVAAASSGEDYQIFETPAEANEALVAGAVNVASSGAHFHIPVVIPEEKPSGDNRIFEKGAIDSRDLPLPLMWQIKTGEGHKGSVVVGRIDYLERIEGGLGNARGVFDVGVFGRECERLVRNGFLRGVSADLDNFSGVSESEDADEELATEEGVTKKRIRNDRIIVDNSRLMGVTVVPKPAFQEAYILIEEPPSLDDGVEIMSDGIYESSLDEMDNELAALAASAAPIVPPRSWFVDPKLTEATPLTVDDDGRVFGHIASWKTNHIGLPNQTKPPRSASKYAYFRTGVLRTDDGDVQVGQITLAGGHASMQASAEDAVKHYDDTASAVVDVIAGEDAHGIWVAGALRPDADAMKVRALRASAPSGDWRPINGRLELVAICAVNVPGFPTVRSIVSGGQVQALVAAGAPELARIKADRALSPLEERISSLENKEIQEKYEKAVSRLESTTETRQNELEALAASAKQRLESSQQSYNAELEEAKARLIERFNS